MRYDMFRLILVIILLAAIPSAAQLQLYPENVFGLDLPLTHWGHNADYQLMGAPETGYIGIPSDAATLRFTSGEDTSEVILISDLLSRQIRILRCQANIINRPLQYISSFGSGGDSTNQFMEPAGLAIASVSEFYNPTTDHIYLADRMNHRLVKLNYTFIPNHPDQDEIIWESSSSLDSNFFPTSMVYFNFRTGLPADNLLAVLDDIGQRLVIYSWVVIACCLMR